MKFLIRKNQDREFYVMATGKLYVFVIFSNKPDKLKKRKKNCTRVVR